MTNDNDKLRRLREWIFYEADVEPNPGGGYSFTEGRANPAHVLVEIDRLLNEHTSPAPAAAPSEGDVAAAEQEADEIVAQAKADNGTQPIGLSKHLRRRISEALMRRAAIAPTSSPPVTSEAIEAAIEKHGMAYFGYGAHYRKELHQQCFDAAVKSEEELDALIARRLQQATAAAEELARAAKRYIDQCDEMSRIRCDDALAAFRKAQGGGK